MAVADTMTGDSKDRLRQHIKIKRALDGLQEVPEDLFAKKPRYEMSEEEKKRQEERRLKNKEAAEKSRKKKKEEFEKLQSENDQLNKEKCELAATIAHLKEELRGVEVKHVTLNNTLDQLKRWIAKRSQELQLNKHHPNENKARSRDNNSQGWEDRPTKDFPDSKKSSGPLLRGDPCLHSTARDDISTASSSETVFPNSTSMVDKIPVASKTIHPARPKLSTPWLVEHVVPREATTAAEVPVRKPVVEETAARSAQKSSSNAHSSVTNHRVIEVPQYTPDQQMILLDNGDVLIIQNAPSASVMEVTPSSPTRNHALSDSIIAAMSVVNGDVNDDMPGSAVSAVDVSKTSAVEGLLRLHCPEVAVNQPMASTIIQIPTDTSPAGQFVTPVTVTDSSHIPVTTTTSAAGISQEQLFKVLQNLGYNIIVTE